MTLNFISGKAFGTATKHRSWGSVGVHPNVLSYTAIHDGAISVVNTSTEAKTEIRNSLNVLGAKTEDLFWYSGRFDMYRFCGLDLT